jgi:hypothetical protein
MTNAVGNVTDLAGQTSACAFLPEIIVSPESYEESRRLDSLIFAIFGFGLANRAALQTMNEPFPERPALFRDFVLPSRSKHFFLNFWVADSHVANSKLSSEEAFRNAVQKSPPEPKRREGWSR